MGLAKGKFAWPSYVTADEIVRHGWAMQYPIEDVMAELQQYGFMVSKIAILETWAQLDDLVK